MSTNHKQKGNQKILTKTLKDSTSAEIKKGPLKSVIRLFIVGIILLILSTIISFALIPRIDHKLSETEYVIDRLDQRKLHYWTNDIKRDIISTTQTIIAFNEFQSPIMIAYSDTLIKAMNKSMDNLRREQIRNIISIHSDTLGIGKMNSGELESYFKIQFNKTDSTYGEFLNKNNDLNDFKRRLLNLSAVLQVLGLLLNQLGLILQVKYKV